MLSEQSNSLQIVWHSNHTHTHTHWDTLLSHSPYVTGAQFSRGSAKSTRRKVRAGEVTPPTWPLVQHSILLTNGSKTMELSNRHSFFFKERLLPFFLFYSPLVSEFWQMGGSHSPRVVISIDLNAVQQPFPADFLSLTPYPPSPLPFPMGLNSPLSSLLKPHPSVSNMPLAHNKVWFIYSFIYLFIFFHSFEHFACWDISDLLAAATVSQHRRWPCWQ